MAAVADIANLVSTAPHDNLDLITLDCTAVIAR